MPGPLAFDVVICTFNRARMLDRALVALARQSERSELTWQVLVIDNNCTDETPSVVEAHRRSGLPVSRVVEPEQGLTAARRRGVASGTAPWIAFVDDDCVVEDSWLEEVARFAREHEDAGAFGGRVRLEWEHEPPDYVLHYPWAFAEQDHGAEPKQVDALVGAGIVVRRAALEECGWTAEQLLDDRIGRRLVSGGDVEIALRIGARHELWYAPSCELRHVISLERTTLAYLRRVVFGLGVSKFLGESMLWPGSYARWQATALVRSRGFAGRALRDARWALIGRRRLADVLIRLSFLGGWLAGSWRLMRAAPHKRNAIIGCAKADRQA
jgi:glycosyltransferase involved in cell wall biosynthesis